MPIQNVLVFNAKGGSARRDPRVLSTTVEAARQLDPHVEVLSCAPHQVYTYARRAALQGATLVVACGGDGTVSAAAAAVAGTHCALGVVPAGTLNHFARDLGVPKSVRAAVEVAFRGRERRVDVACVNGRIFVNNCSLGVYPALIQERRRVEDDLGKLAAAIQAFEHLWRCFPRERVRVHAEGFAPIEIETSLLFVGNNRYTLRGIAATSRQRLDAGVLSVVVLRASTPSKLLASALHAFFVGPERAVGLAYFETRRVRVECESSPVNLGIDGEALLLPQPLEFASLPGALLVRVP